MRQVIVKQPSVSDVPDIFAVVVGPLSRVVDGDVTFAHGLDAADAETAIAGAASELRERWPMIQDIYLTPVAMKRPRGAARVAESSNR